MRMTRFIDDDGVRHILTSVSGQKALNASIDAITGWKARGCDYAAILTDAADALDTLPEMCMPRLVRMMDANTGGFCYTCVVMFFNPLNDNTHNVNVTAPTWALAASLGFVEAERILKDLKVRR